jgi:hypothetical protein
MSNGETIFVRVPISERLPELGKYVPVIDVAGEIFMYCVNDDNSWSLRDTPGYNAPSDNLPMTHWLEETPIAPKRNIIIEKYGH